MRLMVITPSAVLEVNPRKLKETFAKVGQALATIKCEKHYVDDLHVCCFEEQFLLFPGDCVKLGTVYMPQSSVVIGVSAVNCFADWRALKRHCFSKRAGRFVCSHCQSTYLQLD